MEFAEGPSRVVSEPCEYCAPLREGCNNCDWTGVIFRTIGGTLHPMIRRRIIVYGGPKRD